ncbi:hypothetical protein OsJ_03916 [Oryza sativa Japonica Group]|uniref:Uncharacterized protein n=1 Tax=Oryza sativa subsp. japonica TaxID=39947 RepID=B9EU82_ORYSJ|nr:hypothetical protein OsJ_03916 [Oryza sativa Japonica Group]
MISTEEDSDSFQDDSEELQMQVTKKTLKRVISLAETFIAIATGILAAAFSAGKDVHLHRHVLAAGGCFLVVTYLSALLLIYMKLFLSDHRRLRRWHVRSLQLLCVTSGASLVATNSLLLVLIGEGNGLLSLNLLPVQGIVGVLAYHATPTEGSARDEAFEAQVKSARKVALFAAATAFAVQTTLVFGAFSNAALQAMGGRRLDLSVSFLASALSVFLVVATCMPLGFRNQGARDKVLSIEFLGGAAALALFPEITVAAMYYAMEVLPTVVVATFGFGMLGAAYAALFGTPEYDLYTKALAFTLLTAVVSSLGRVAGPLCNAQRDKSSAAWVTFLSSILPIVEMLVAVPLAAKVMVDFLAVPGNG